MSLSKKFLPHSLIILIVLLSIIGMSVFLYVYNATKVKTIKIQGSHSGDTLFGLNSLKDDSLLFLSEKKVNDVVGGNNPIVSSVTIKKQYPQTLLLTLFYYQPFAYLKASSGYFLLNRDSRVLKKIKDEEFIADLPVIHYFQNINISTYQQGDKINYKDMMAAFSLLTAVSKENLIVNTIDIDGVDVIGFNLKGKSILFSSEKDAGGQVYQLEQIIHQFRIQGKEFKKLDLRFNRPVLELVE